MDIEVTFPNMTSTLQISGCAFGVKPPGWSYPMHHHHLFEILYCFSGEAVQLLGTNERTLRSGDWMLIKSGVRHRTENRSDAPYAFFNIHFDVDDPSLRKRLTVANYRVLARADAAAAGLPEIVRRVERLMAAKLANDAKGMSTNPAALAIDPLHKLELQAAILLIVTALAEHRTRSAPESRKPRLSVASLLETDTAHAIEERLRCMAAADTDESIARIAHDLHLSRSQFTKLFTKVYGIPPRQYVSELVVNRAKRLLVTTNRSIEAIAMELGFHSVSHFSRQFRRWTGVSPMQYRPKHE
ncbi:AraC family transcriptional regulator [Paenibacillus mesophilus]|uniref:AraC family transcriptional regulator n=1 Tax=Paenibacillus mesophilus TaxID=2582849 RepID=UPI00110DF95E|nr:helix-turn-helix domain-containing protein [Paenibacillus mesophilus]TMV46950.1 AraC family transcriptional regulator [Paenibacillus mesophilus]